MTGKNNRMHVASTHKMESRSRSRGVGCTYRRGGGGVGLKEEKSKHSITLEERRPAAAPPGRFPCGRASQAAALFLQ